MLILTGFLGGTCAGLLGLGGGVVMTPLCAIIYPLIGVNDDVLFKVIFGTNFLIILISTTISTYRYQKKKLILWRATFPLAAAAVAGVLIGVFFVDKASNKLLEQFFGIFALIAGIRMFIKFEESKDKEPVYSIPVLALTGMSSAIVGAFVGVGGGIVMIPVMILLLNFKTRNCPPTTNSVMIFTALASMIGYMIIGWNNSLVPENSIGFVYLGAGLPLALGAVFGAPTGTWLNSIVSTVLLKKIFAVVLFIVFLKMVVF
ncbi:sulfite exporter TauE/SafE family protein [candidate division KSB1 bacterium]